jgi:hypothetical protein
MQPTAHSQQPKDAETLVQCGFRGGEKGKSIENRALQRGEGDETLMNRTLQIKKAQKPQPTAG